MQKPYGTANADRHNTAMLQDCVNSLPIHTELTEEELQYITSNLLEIIG